MGEIKIKEHKVVHYIVIYEKDQNDFFGTSAPQKHKFEFDDTCPDFFFNKKNTDELLFFQPDGVIKFNYKTDTESQHYKLPEHRLDNEPDNAIFGPDQTEFMFNTRDNVYYVNTKNNLVVDIDELEGISEIKDILVHDKYFYILCNKRDERLGFFLLRFDTSRPKNNCEYLINWPNKLDIGNCDLYSMKEGEDDNIVISFKSIGINTYNVFVIDINTKLIRFWFEGNQFWEMPVKGFLLDTHDFMWLNKDGINVICIAEREPRLLTDSMGQLRTMHALGSMNYLKIEPSNHILFACQVYENRKVCV